LRFTIEPLLSHDEQGLSDLLSIYQEAIEPSEQKPPEEIARFLANESFSIFVARKTKEIAGFTISYFPPNAEFWLLDYMAVAKDARSQGIGEKLLQSAIEYAHKRDKLAGLMEVDIEHEEKAAPARRLGFYARFGCRRISGLNYVLPQVGAGLPPPMQLLVHGLIGQEFLPKDTLRDWITTLYTEHYSSKADDPRIAIMMDDLPVRIPLASIG
jgi:GNAT superfamily N-acetyltransferase